MTFTNMLAMWFCENITKNIPPYSILRGEYVMHVKGVKQKWSNKKSMVKQVIRAAGIVNRHYMVVRNWSPRKVMDLYLGVRHLFDFTCLSSVKRRRYVLMFPPDSLRVDARRWSGRWYKRDRRRDSSTNHRCAKIGFNRAEDEQLQIVVTSRYNYGQQ